MNSSLRWYNVKLNTQVLAGIYFLPLSKKYLKNLAEKEKISLST